MGAWIYLYTCSKTGESYYFWSLNPNCVKSCKEIKY